MTSWDIVIISNSIVELRYTVIMGKSEMIIIVALLGYVDEGDWDYCDNCLPFLACNMGI